MQIKTYLRLESVIEELKSATKEAALEELTRAIMESPGNPEPFKQRGYFRLMKSDPAGAIEDFNEVLLLDQEFSFQLSLRSMPEMLKL